MPLKRHESVYVPNQQTPGWERWECKVCGAFRYADHKFHYTPWNPSSWCSGVKAGQ